MSPTRWMLDGAYLVSALLFVAGLKGLGKVKNSRRGNVLATLGMLVAALATLVEGGAASYTIGALGIGAAVGALLGLRINVSTAGSVGLLTASGGTAAVLVALSTAWRGLEANTSGNLASLLGSEQLSGAVPAVCLVLVLVLGALVMSGGVLAFLKSSGVVSDKPMQLPARGLLWSVLLITLLVLLARGAFLASSPEAIRVTLFAAIGAGVLSGFLLLLPLGGRDLPTAMSLLNACAGLSGAALGFVLANNALLMTGGIIFAAGLVLARVFSDGLNRSLGSALFGMAAGEQAGNDTGGASYGSVRSCGVEEAAMVLEDARSVVLVPGFGYALAQAQHAARELAHLLEKRGVKVKYAVHPLAGRMPGHMNLLLSEANVPYEQLYEVDEINAEFKDTDVVIVLGGNDIVNPDAEQQEQSPVYGMPILRVSLARTVFVIKRSLRPGHSGARNPLFEAENTMLLFGDAKKVLQSITSELKGSSMAHAA